MNETKDDLHQRRDISYLWIGRLILVKISILPILTYRFNTIPVQIPAGFLTEADKLNPKWMWGGGELGKATQF